MSAYGIVAVVNAISEDVVNSLAAAGYPALVDGKILIGRQKQFEMSAPPRIVFVPLGSKWGPRSPASPSPASGVTAPPNAPGVSSYTPDQRAEIIQRPLYSEMARFEIRCWGVAPDSIDPTDDILVTEALYRQVIASTHKKAVGSFELIRETGGTWTDASLKSAQLMKDGLEFVFHMAIGVPVLDTLLRFTPQGTTVTPSRMLQTPTGQTGVA